MPYIPLNRIQTDLFTAGGEYVYLASGIEYTGDYYSLYNGQTFSGATPNAPFSEEIVPIFSLTSTQDETPFEGRSVYVPLETEDPDIQVPYRDTLYDAKMLDQYIKLQGQRPDQVGDAARILAQDIKPTEQDYQKGQFFRFFVKKRNEPLYIEINRKIFSSIKNQDTKVYSKYYLPFRLLWTLTGPEDDVFEANRTITTKAEQFLQLTFLSDYLEQDWLKFYKES